MLNVVTAGLVDHGSNERFKNEIQGVCLVQNRMLMSNLVRTTCFWSNLHQVTSVKIGNPQKILQDLKN